MNSEKIKTSKPHVLMLKFTVKLDLRRSEKIIALWKNIRSSCNNSKFKISAPARNDKFE